MKRNHIHFAKGLPGANSVISGMRQDCNLLIYVHLPSAIEGEAYCKNVFILILSKSRSILLKKFHSLL